MQLPVRLLLIHKLPITLAGLRALLEMPEILIRSQTYAFTALGMSQLFHAIGMRDVDCSLFHMKHLTNKLMIAAVSIGLALQVLVTSLPKLTAAFGTCTLAAADWKRLLFLSAMPLLMHEVLVLLKLMHRDR